MKRVVYSKRIGIILVIAGVILTLFPFLKYEYYEKSLTIKSRIQQSSINAVNKTKSPEVKKDDKLPEKLLDESGILRIPKLELEFEVNYGVDEENLKKGPGFYPESGYPDSGNVSIAGHRNAHGSPFWHLNKLEPGDEISLYYREKLYEYKIDSVFVTHNRDWSVVAPTQVPALTLTTCHPLKPIGGSYDRLIVRAYLMCP